MKNYLIYCCALVLLFGINACKKKPGDNHDLDDKNIQPFDIMPTTKGSWWLYKADNGVVFYRYATGKDTFTNGLTYQYFYRIDTTSDDRVPISEYFTKNDSKYVTLIDLDGAQKNYITSVLLKDNSYTGLKWPNTETTKLDGWKVDISIESEILSTNEQLTIEGKLYDSVVHVFNKLQAKSVLSPSYTNCGTIEIWFKKGIGVVKQKGIIDINPAGIKIVEKNYTDELLDYHFEP